MRRVMLVAVVAIVLLVCSNTVRCQEGEATELQSAAPKAFAKLPAKEITVFKDGHAFVLHEGEMQTDAVGNVVMDYLPAPVIGTFWPYSSDPNAKLTSVVAGRHRVAVERTALSMRELLEANIGARVHVKENNGSNYAAILLGIPARSSRELEATSPPNSEARLPQKGNVILLKTEQGTKVVALNNIQDVTFMDPCKTSVAAEEFRNLLTLKLDWNKKKPAKKASVGLVYLQKGVRWIPSYKVAIDGNGNAAVKLQATLINELTDLEDVTVNLVIGVPTFAFQDTPDPISLQQAVANLSRYFQRGSQSAHAFSNAIMTQAARMGEYRAPAAPETSVDLGPDIPGSAKSEDLFVFTVKNVSLRKGERMVLPVAEYSLPYKDIYTLDIPFAPPPGVRKHFSSRQQAELAKLFRKPKVMHKIRLVNKSSYPLTTAPALIILGDRVLAQGMMTYTAVGASTDLKITTAVDIRVNKSDTETKRIPNAASWDGHSYYRVELSGKISLTNYASQTVDMEVVRHVLGNADAAGQDGVVEQINVLEDDDCIPAGGYPRWWGWYSWPWWWYHFNRIGRVTWKFKLEPGKSVKLGYTWHYYWR